MRLVPLPSALVLPYALLIRQSLQSRFTRFNISMVVCAMLFAFAAPSWAGLLDDDEARKAILELRAEVRKRDTDQAEKINRLGATSADTILQIRAELTQHNQQIETLKRTVLDLNNALTQAKESNANLSGQLEILTNAQQLQTTELQAQRKKQSEQDTLINNRFKQLEPRTVAVDGKEALVDKAEEATFNAALNQFKAADYNTASHTFITFIAQYPQSGLLGTAYFWLGNSQYANHELKAANLTLQVMLQKFPEHARAADAALTLALSYNEAGDKKRSQETYQYILNTFPATAAAQTAEQALAKTKEIKRARK